MACVPAGGSPSQWQCHSMTVEVFHVVSSPLLLLAYNWLLASVVHRHRYMKVLPNLLEVTFEAWGLCKVSWLSCYLQSKLWDALPWIGTPWPSGQGMWCSQGIFSQGNAPRVIDFRAEARLAKVSLNWLGEAGGCVASHFAGWSGMPSSCPCFWLADFAAVQDRQMVRRSPFNHTYLLFFVSHSHLIACIYGIHCT